MEKKRYSYKQYIEAFRIPEDIMLKLGTELPSGIRAQLVLTMDANSAYAVAEPGKWVVLYPDKDSEVLSDEDFTKRFSPE